MEDVIRAQILHLVGEAHSMVEKEYLKHPAKKAGDGWLEKRRLLLADMALHLAQTGVQPQTDVKLIKRYLYSLLTLCADFVPEAGLKETAEKLLDKETEKREAAQIF